MMKPAALYPMPCISVFYTPYLVLQSKLTHSHDRPGTISRECNNLLEQLLDALTLFAETKDLPQIAVHLYTLHALPWIAEVENTYSLAAQIHSTVDVLQCLLTYFVFLDP